MLENVTIEPADGYANGVRLVSGAAPVSPSLRWATWYGLDANKTFRFEFRWTGIPKGGAGEGEGMYTPWSRWKTTEHAADSCGPTTSKADDMFHWSIALSRIADVSTMTGSGVWSYESREYDQIKAEVRITSVKPGGYQDDQCSVYTFFIGAYPKFSVDDMYMQGDWLVIAYSAPGWTRKDDRWEILSFTKGGRDVLARSWGHQAGKVDRFGWVTVPKSALQQLLQEGDRVNLHIRWNAAYRDIQLEWGEWSGQVAVSGHGSANRPTGGVVVNPDGSISVGVGDSGQGGGPIDSWQVTIQGGGTEFDSAEADKLSPTVMLRYPPLDVPVTIQIQGSTATGGTGGIVEQTVTVPSRGVAMLDPVDSTGERVGRQVKAAYNLEWDRDASRDKEVVKFAGRPRPSVAFGKGGEASVTAKWSVPWDGKATLADVRALGDAGYVVARFPGGERYLLAVDSVKTAESCGSRVTEASISGQEVV